MSPEPGLYVHVPFCSALCPYCDFAVNVGSERKRRARFVSLLLDELDVVELPAHRFDTLYFGGGTPSLLEVDEIARLIDGFRSRDLLAADCRLFLEANPEDLTASKLAGWRNAGVSTLSLGVQSFDPDSLRFLGRRHSPEDARQAVELAREADFATVSLDLMYGLSGQSSDTWRRDLERALALSPDHVSCYQLTIHDRTVFGKRTAEGRLRPPPTEVEAELFRLTHRVCESFGYQGYEVSNFARSAGHRSRHNEKYWSHASYLGLGPSAHSFDGRERSWNERSFFDWARSVSKRTRPLADRESLDDEALLLETLMLRLRTKDGLDLSSVEERFGVDLLALNRPLIDRALADSLFVLDDRMLRPTLEGLALADGLAGAFRTTNTAETKCPLQPK
jgi:oxygen-independent coproporphyrinogen-3 oxidase